MNLFNEPITLMSVAVILFSFVGCSGNEEFGTVSGTVTLDGEALEDAVVHFQPEHGRTSIGITDSDGEYQLDYTRDRKGAEVGKHTVKIIRQRDLGAPPADAKSGTRLEPKPLPKRYNTESTLTKEVKPGSNSFDFNLKSDGA